MKTKITKKDSLKKLQTVRNIGPATARDLYAIGIKTPAVLRRANPKKLYEKLKKKHGGQLDRCVLYVLRGAKVDKPWHLCKDLKKIQEKNKKFI